MEALAIRPMDGAGWMAQMAGIGIPEHYANGAQAETAARRLAKRLAKAGRRSEILIYLRDGALGGRFTAAPA